MKFIRQVLLILTISLITACASTNNPYPETTEPGFTPDSPSTIAGSVISCSHKYEPGIKFSYERTNITRFVVNNVVTFYILDINGNDIFLSYEETENYNCR